MEDWQRADGALGQARTTVLFEANRSTLEVTLARALIAAHRHIEATHPRPESDIERAARGFVAADDEMSRYTDDPQIRQQRGARRSAAIIALITAVEANAPPKGVTLSEEEAEAVVRLLAYVPCNPYDRIRRSIRARLEASR